MKTVPLLAVLSVGAVLVFSCIGAGCDPSGLAPGLTGEGLNQAGDGSPSVSLSPADQDIRDEEEALLVAATANLPAAGVDNDGIHGEAILRWSVVEGPGGLKPVSTSASATEAAVTIDTVPDGQYGNVASYVPVLGSSGVVRVKVEVIRPTDRTVINEFGEAKQEHEDIVIASAEAVLHINDEGRLELTPPLTKLPSGGVVQLKAIFKSEDGAPDPGQAINLFYEWRMTGLAGAGDLQSSSDSDTATFTAFSEVATFTISVKTTETLADGTELVNGPAYAVVQVDPKLKTVNTFGYYFSKDESTDPNYYSVVAWVYIPKIQGALSYTVVGQDMHDSAFYGTGHTWSFSKSGSGISGLEESGGAYRFGLSSASGSAAAGSANAFGWMSGRFSGMRVLVSAVVQE